MWRNPAVLLAGDHVADRRWSRRSRPQIEVLEGRTLLAIMRTVSPGSVLAFTSLASTPNQGNYVLAGDPNSVTLAPINGAGLTGAQTYGTVNYSGDTDPLSPDKSIELIADAYAANYSSATSKVVTSNTGDFSDTNGSYIGIKILPDGISDEEIGDPVSVTLTGTYGHTPQGGSSVGQAFYQIGYNPTGGSGDYHNLLGPTTDNQPNGQAITQTAQFDTTIGSVFYVALSAGATALQNQGSQAFNVDSDLTLDLHVDDLPKPSTGGSGGGGSGGGGGGGSSSSPVASNYTVSVANNQTLRVAAPGILTSDSDPAGRPIHVVSYGNSAHGTLTVYSDGSFTYIPSANYTGTDSFAYEIADSAGLTATGAVVITVDPAVPSAPPVTTPSIVTTPAGSTPSGLTAEELALLLLLVGESTAVSPSQALSPYVVSVVRIRSHHATRELIVTYSSGNGLGDASNPGDYSVASIVKHGKGKVQRVRSVAYDATSHAATINLAKPIRGHAKLRLSVVGVLPTGSYTATV
jgi:hypothetical protein